MMVDSGMQYVILKLEVSIICQAQSKTFLKKIRLVVKMAAKAKKKTIMLDPIYMT